MPLNMLASQAGSGCLHIGPAAVDFRWKVCPPPCRMMHGRCQLCGEIVGPCLNRPEPADTTPCDEYGHDPQEWCCVPDPRTGIVQHVKRARRGIRVDFTGSSLQGAVDPLFPCPHTDTWFDRSVCPEPCGSMHDRCTECGRAVDGCPFEEAKP